MVGVAAPEAPAPSYTNVCSMPKYGESEAVKAVKNMIAEQLNTRERAMLQAWILARFDVRGDREQLPSR